MRVAIETLGALGEEAFAASFSDLDHHIAEGNSEPRSLGLTVFVAAVDCSCSAWQCSCMACLELFQSQINWMMVVFRLIVLLCVDKLDEF